MGDRITIENGTIILETEEGQRFEHPERVLSEMLRLENTPPLGKCLLPDGVKFTQWRDPFFLVVHQYPAHVRRLLWIRKDSPVKYGPGTLYRPVRLSLPYTIIFAIFYRRGRTLFLTNSNELYFSNQPLTSKTDKLCYPALAERFRYRDTEATAIPGSVPSISNARRNPTGPGNWTHYCSTSGMAPGTCRASRTRVQAGMDIRRASTLICTRFKSGKKQPERTPVLPALLRGKPVPLTVEELVECMFEESFSQLQGAVRSIEGPNKSDVSLPTRFMNFQWKRGKGRC